jgi:uncharacterized MAPEG superfamily protein
MEVFEAYSHAILSLALWALIVTFLSGASTVGRSAEKRCDCGKPKRDYSDVVYRRERAFMNAVESSGPFIASTVAAILAGAPSFWVNLLASVAIVARLVMVAVHIGTENQALRSASFVVGWVCMIAMALLAVFAVL